MLISVHIPKTAGSSFREYLRLSCPENLILDYGDPIYIPDIARNAFVTLSRAWNKIQNHQLSRPDHANKIIHGHFITYKYASIRNNTDTKYITWLRDPIERIISQYYFWYRHYTPETRSPLHKKIVEENWSLEKFCLSQQLQNIYAKFFWKFPIDHFSFIGITECYDTDLQYFANRFLNDQTPTIIYGNENPNKKADYIDSLEPQLIKKIRAFHAEDFKIYETALRLRDQRTLL